MAFKKTIDSVYELAQAFEDAGRGDYFSNEGLQAMLDDTMDFDTEPELDVIALCCEYSEYTTDELLDDYDTYFDGYEPDEINDMDNYEIASILEDNGICCQLLNNDNILIRE